MQSAKLILTSDVALCRCKRGNPTRGSGSPNPRRATRASRDQAGSSSNPADRDEVVAPSPSAVVGQLLTYDDSCSTGHIMKAKAASLTAPCKIAYS